MKKSYIKDIGQEKWTEEIFKTFDFDKNNEVIARDLLHSYRKKFDPTPLLKKIKSELKGKQPIFFGAGPNLEDDLIQFQSKLEHDDTKNQKGREHYYVIAADGAANALVDYKLLPDIIFTDLDGLNYPQIEYFIKNNVILIVHAHGDNIRQLEDELIKNLLSSTINMIGTTQIAPKFPIINPGGFTDGDRALFFCHHLSPPSALFYLGGFEFGEYAGKYSKNSQTPMKMSPFKKKKMNFCKRLIEYISTFREINYLPHL